MRRLSSLLALLTLLCLAFPALARPRLTASQRAEVKREIRAQAQWHFTLFDGRRPSIRTSIKPVAGNPNQFTASAQIVGIWRGVRTPLADNHFTITRKPDGKVTVVSPHPFIPR